jgi:hypothetical protein
VGTTVNEPDYEAIMEARDEARAEAWLDRMDREYGTVDQFISGPSRRCACGKLWGDGQAEHDCPLLRP